MDDWNYVFVTVLVFQGKGLHRWRLWLTSLWPPRASIRSWIHRTWPNQTLHFSWESWDPPRRFSIFSIRKKQRIIKHKTSLWTTLQPKIHFIIARLRVKYAKRDTVIAILSVRLSVMSSRFFYHFTIHLMILFNVLFTYSWLVYTKLILITLTS